MFIDGICGTRSNQGASMTRKVGRPRNQWKTSKIAIPQPILEQVNELVAKFKREQEGK